MSVVGLPNGFKYYLSYTCQFEFNWAQILLVTSEKFTSVMSISRANFCQRRGKPHSFPEFGANFRK